MKNEGNHCAQCNKIRALPWSQTRRDMTADHMLDLGHQAHLVEALEVRRERDEAVSGADASYAAFKRTSDENTAIREELDAVKGRLAKLIEAARIVARLYNLPGLLNACTEAEAGGPAELGRIDTGLVATLNRTIDELRRDRAKWVKVCDERDNRIIELCNLMRRIKDYAGQHTYPFANAIVDLCNQVLEPK